MLFPVRDEEYRPVLPLTTSRCVSGGAKEMSYRKQGGWGRMASRWYG